MRPIGTDLRDAVVLAAGGSRRMGSPKALLILDGEPLILAHVRGFQAAGLRVTVVVGAEAGRVIGVLPGGVRVVENRAWESTDAAASAALALASLGPALLTPVDVPPAAPNTLAALLAAEGCVVPRFSGRDGHPVRLDPPHPPRRLDERLRHAHRIDVLDPDCVLNLNTPDAWTAWLAARAARRA